MCLMTKSILIPLNNVSAKGDFCAEVAIGSPPQVQHLIVDTGSSALVVKATTFDSKQDLAIAPTTFIQHMRYGIGDWIGPIVHSSAQLGHGFYKAQIDAVSFSIAESIQTGTFANADGMLGLAYRELDHAHNASSILEELNLSYTWPWNDALDQRVATRDFVTKLVQQPDKQLVPLFTALEEHQVVANQFAFLVHRSSIFHSDTCSNPRKLALHPLNRGFLALGRPHLHTHLHKPNYQHVKVVHDKYYNVELLSLNIKGQAPIPAPTLSDRQLKISGSNAIVDTGASAIVLPEKLFKALFQQFKVHNPAFEQPLKSFEEFSGQEQGIPIENVELDKWPDIELQLVSEDGTPTVLTITPHSYWQTHAPQSNQISFKLITLPNWGEQAILGLPLLCEYYCIFDRSRGESGVISFADKQVAPHRLSDTIHNDIEKLTALFKQHKIHST